MKPSHRLLLCAALLGAPAFAPSSAFADKDDKDKKEHKDDHGLTKEDRDDIDRTMGVNDFKERDKNKNDKLELKEYLADIEEKDRQEKRERLFHKVDLNHDGHVTREEVREVLNKIDSESADTSKEKDKDKDSKDK